MTTETPTDPKTEALTTEMPAGRNTESPPTGHRRTGKVARLPAEVRDHLNQMLLDGVPYAKIIEELGDHGKDLSEDNIGSWKAGGYEDWLRQLERLDALESTRENALGLVKQKAGVTVQNAGRTVAAAQLYELLLSFDPTAFSTALAKKPELYLRLINSLSRLSEGESLCGQRQAQTVALLPKPTPQPGSPGAPNIIDQETLKQIARLIKLL
jgi:hypothetical protein